MQPSLDHLFFAPSDYQETFNYYRDALGFQLVHSWGGGGQPRGAALSLGSMKVVLAERHDDAEDDAWSSGINGARPTIHVRCIDIQEMNMQLHKGAARVVVPMQKTHWGVVWLVVADPDGNLIAFFQEQEPGT